jgi:hypothetical protein
VILSEPLQVTIATPVDDSYRGPGEILTLEQIENIRRLIQNYVRGLAQENPVVTGEVTVKVLHYKD